MYKRIVVIVALIAFGVTNLAAVTPRLVSQADIKKCDRWVDSVYNSLSERQRVAQLIFPKVVPTQGANSRATIKRLVESGQVGGLIFTEGSIEQFVEMTNYAQSIARVPLLMTFDGEWGPAMRIRGSQRFPVNMAIGAARDGEALAYEYGREMARECRAAGIQVNFAPVADVNSNPANPVIGYRSFGEHPADVARLTVAYSRGLEDGGVQAVAKHFPGHGDTETDSHKTLPSVDKSIKELGKTELVPFNAFIRDGGSGIMTAHLSVPAIDKKGTPMSLSRPAHRLLREKMGFEGLVYTDALGMKGAVSPDGTNATVAALRAGADVLLCPRKPVEDIDAILALVKSGKISKDVIEDRCKRILRYKYLLGLEHHPATLDVNKIRALLTGEHARATNHRLSAAVLTALKNDASTLPVKNLAKQRIAVVCLGANTDNAFVTTCRRYAEVDIVDAANITKLKNYTTVIVAVFNDKATTRSAAENLARLDNTVAVFMVNPYKMAKMSGLVRSARAVLIAYDDTQMLREVAAQAIFGGVDVDGHLPVTLKGLYERGDGIKIVKNRLGYTEPELAGMSPFLTDTIDSLVNRAITDGAMPGAQVLIARHGNVVLDRSYGTTATGGDIAVDPFTVYDLASVSKAIGTLPGVMKAVDKGLVDIDEPASKYIQGLRDTDKADITVRQLLFHETGMPAALNMFTTMMDTATYEGALTSTKKDATHTIMIQKNYYGHRDARLRTDIVSTRPTAEMPVAMAHDMYVGQAAMDTIMGRIYNAKLRPTKNYNYSCLNFALLMDAEQHATGIRHDVWCDSLIWKPLGAWTMGYRPAERLPLSQIAPTEKDNYLRRQTVHGYVHDEMAAFSGGVQGNAGLFANADDIAKMCQMWLNGGSYGGEQILSHETVRLFTTTVSPTCRRGLGFDKPDTQNPENSPTTDIATPSTFGHLGFTGTVFWVDPENDLIVIFLTNRVNPTRDNAAFAASGIRPAIMRRAIEAVVEQ